MNDEQDSTVISATEKKRSHILKVSHALTVAAVVPCIFAISSPFIFPGSKVADVFSNLGLAFLSAIIVYKFIELWVDKEYRELRIQEYRSTLLHRDSITSILKDGAVEDILECCLGVLLIDKEFASGTRRLLGKYKKEIPLSLHNLRETITVSEHDDKYYKLKRVISFSKSRIPSTISFRCKLVETEEEDRGVVFDRTREESWTFLNHPSDSILPEEAYKVIQLKVGDDRLSPIETNPRKSDNEIEFLFSIPDKYAGKSSRHRIRYEMEVLQSKTGGFYSFVNVGPTKGVYVTFKSEIGKKCHVVAEGISCIEEPEIIRHENSYEVNVDDWVFPNSCIVFAWS